MNTRGFVFAIALFTLSCSSKDSERKIALQTTTNEATNTEENSTSKKTSAIELESQFKGCKAHW